MLWGMNPLVTPSWLADRLTDRNTVVLDASLPPVGSLPAPDTRARYLAAHIPGAVFFDIDELSDHRTTLPHMLPTPEEFARSMSALGIGDGHTIVVYEQEGVFSARGVVDAAHLSGLGMFTFSTAGCAPGSRAATLRSRRVQPAPASFPRQIRSRAAPRPRRSRCARGSRTTPPRWRCSTST